VLDLAILGLLGNGPLHGYEIRRRLRAQLGLLANFSFGSLYPALARLEANGDVEAVEADEHDDSLPSTGSLSGERAAQRARRLVGGRGRRSRKAYRLTEKGRASFDALLNASGGADDSRSFGLRWSLASHLAPSARLSLLDRRRAQLVQQLGEPVPADGLDDYARSVVEHARSGVAQDIAWLDDLIAAERGAMQSAEPETTSNIQTEGASPPPHETSPA